MNPLSRFTTKAERYAKYRWGYAPEVVQAIFSITGLTSEASIADVGSGTGLLTKEIAGKVRSIYAIEPNAAMREIAERLLNQVPGYTSLAAKAEATLLPDHCVDLITVGQALHWFEPHATLDEFHRILQPNGWLAVVFHSTIRQAELEAAKRYFTPEYGWDPVPSPKPVYGESHTDFYLDPASVTNLQFPQTWDEDWEMFIGGILSDSHAPDDTNPALPRFMSAVQRVFNRFSTNGIIQVHGGTGLVLGHLRGAGV